jgi:hypothetical protein
MKLSIYILLMSASKRTRGLPVERQLDEEFKAYFLRHKSRDCRAIGRCVGVFRRYAAGRRSFYFTLP